MSMLWNCILKWRNVLILNITVHLNPDQSVVNKVQHLARWSNAMFSVNQIYTIITAAQTTVVH